MYVRVNRETKFATMAEKFRGKGCSFKYLSFFSTCVRRYFAWNGKLNIHSDVIRKKNWLARFVDWKIDRFHEDNGRTEYFIRTEAKVKQIFDGEKKKKKELSLGFEKFSIDAKRRYVYTQKKKKKESHCHVQQIIPFFPPLICGIIEGEDISLLVKEEGEGEKRIGWFLKGTWIKNL